jgi:hypothetical protein
MRFPSCNPFKLGNNLVIVVPDVLLHAREVGTEITFDSKVRPLDLSEGLALDAREES